MLISYKLKRIAQNWSIRIKVLLVNNPYNINEMMSEKLHGMDESESCCTIDTVDQSMDSKQLNNLDEHSHENEGGKPYILATISFVLLISGLIMDHMNVTSWFKDQVRIAWYLSAYLPVGWPVIREAFHFISRGSVFTEFFLMSIATLGAFAIGEYPEAVGVMLFYAVGELFQNAAVARAKKNITSLLDVRADVAHVFIDNEWQDRAPEEVPVGSRLRVLVGERLPVDGILRSPKAALNTASLTGESTPMTYQEGDEILAGSINLEQVIELDSIRLFDNSAISRVLHLIEEAQSRKSKSELLIRKLAKIYTPIVVVLALFVMILPYFFVSDYIFRDWLYRALIFLVISCPCALVISIPLGYFGGLGAASREGILFKGATYLEQIKDINVLVMDKTGTVTHGVFDIVDIQTTDDIDTETLMKSVMTLEKNSTHPIAQAIMRYPQDGALPEASQVEEHAGMGISGEVLGQPIAAGNGALMAELSIEVPAHIQSIVETVVIVAINQRYAGHIVIADELKTDAQRFITDARNSGIDRIVMLSGDKQSITQEVARNLQITEAKGDLMPEDKLYEVEQLQKNAANKVAFMGDGINDAPVLAASDVGIAMGGLGSDVAIETADVVIQTDQPSKFITARRIARSTQRIIWQNIALAIGVKILVLILGTMGMASMWQAVFADVGVAFLAIMNAIRLQFVKW